MASDVYEAQEKALQAFEEMIIQNQQISIRDQQVLGTKLRCNVVVIDPPQHKTAIQTEAITSMQGSCN